MTALRTLRRAAGTAVLTAAVSATALSLAAPAQASPLPPSADSALLGTWVNTNAATRSVVQVIVSGNRDGSVDVNAFGACSPSSCDWGSVQATVYGTSVSATSGRTFQTNQAFLSGRTEWARTDLTGTVTVRPSGDKLTLRELTVFEDGSGRHNYTQTETFVHGSPATVSTAGNPVSGFPQGSAPALATGAFGGWVNVNAGTRNIVKLSITGTAANPVVEAFGACSPTPCDFGTTSGVTYGASIAAAKGKVLLAPWTFGFKNTQLIIAYSSTATGEKLTVSEYNEFTDGSGRSNYTVRETFVRS